MERASTQFYGVELLNPKTEGGLALRNLSVVKHSLKANHVFNHLNSNDVI